MTKCVVCPASDYHLHASASVPPIPLYYYCRGISLIRNSLPPWDYPRTLGIVLL